MANPLWPAKRKIGHEETKTVVVLGERYTDTLTGFSGTATARTEFLYGCVRVGLEGPGENNVPEEHWFDEQRLVHEQSRAAVETDAVTGGARPGPPRRRTR